MPHVHPPTERHTRNDSDCSTAAVNQTAKRSRAHMRRPSNSTQASGSHKDVDEGAAAALQWQIPQEVPDTSQTKSLWQHESQQIDSSTQGPSTLWTRLSMLQDTQVGQSAQPRTRPPLSSRPAPRTKHHPLLTQPAISAGMHAPNPSCSLCQVAQLQ